MDFAFQNGVEYKINVYSVIEYEGDWIESEPLHEKVTKYFKQKESHGESRAVIEIARASAAKPLRRPSFKRKPSVRKNTSRRESDNEVEQSLSKRKPSVRRKPSRRESVSEPFLSKRHINSSTK